MRLFNRFTSESTKSKLYNSNNGKHHDYDRETEKLRRYEF